MLLSKFIIEPVDNYLNDWFGALPFEAVETIMGITLIGSVDTDIILDAAHSEWEQMDFMDKVEIHEENWETYESYTQHMEIPHLIVRQKEWEY
jgi:hypothetical protein